MKVTNEILKIIDSITMDSILVITGCDQDEYKIVTMPNNLLDIVTTTDPNIFLSVNTRSFKTIEEIKNRLVADISLGRIKEIDVLNRR